MKPAALNFSQMLRQMKHDPMLLIIVFVPIIVGALFRFGFPFAEMQLTSYLATEHIISPYYSLLDLILVIFTPAMFNFVVAMVVLEEADERLISYLAVTPLGKAGYLISRFGFTGIISLAISILIFSIFHLTDITIPMLLGIIIISAAQGIGAAMLIVTLSANKVEGMAVGKFTMLFIFGAIAPFFISGKAQYIFSVLPSFWLARAIRESSYIFVGIALLVVVAWIALLARRFSRKVF